MTKQNFKKKKYNKKWKYCNNCNAIVQVINYRKELISKPYLACSCCRSTNFENITKKHK